MLGEYQPADRQRQASKLFNCEPRSSGAVTRSNNCLFPCFSLCIQCDALAHALSAGDVCLAHQNQGAAHPRHCLYIDIVVARSPNKMPSATGRLRAALRCAARYLKEEHTAATSTRNGVPFLHRPAATAVGTSATVSFCSESPAVTDKCIMSVSSTKRRIQGTCTCIALAYLCSRTGHPKWLLEGSPAIHAI